MTSLQIVAWNVIGLATNMHELVSLINNNKLDVVLISESHVTTWSCINVTHISLFSRMEEFTLVQRL